MMMAFDIIALSLFVSSNDIKAKRFDSHVGLRRKTPFVSFGNDIKNIGMVLIPSSVGIGRKQV